MVLAQNGAAVAVAILKAGQQNFPGFAVVLFITAHISTHAVTEIALKQNVLKKIHRELNR